jgi:proteasome accessory factor B
VASGDYPGRVSSRRAERLVNLVLCLLSTRQFLTAERIRIAVPGYEPDDGTARADEAFKRMFERDKAELRELGIPLETGRTSIFDVEEGYRIARRDYELPEVSLEPDEAAAVGLAARLWQSAELADAARGALLKLRAGGVDVEPARTLDVEPRLDAAEEALHPCLDAVQAGRAVRFAYRKPNGSESDRQVEPWGVVSWRGRWYLVGHDRDRGAPRCFRLSRVLGAVSPAGPEGAVKVPTGIDLVEYVVATEPPEFHRVARVRVRRGQGTWLRKIAARIEPGERGSDWDVAEIGYDDPEWIADRVARQGSGAVVDEPVEVREAVIRRLRAHAGPARPAAARRGTPVAAGGPARAGGAARTGADGARDEAAPVPEGRR